MILLLIPLGTSWSKGRPHSADSVAVFSVVFQLMFAIFSSPLVDLLQVLIGLPTFLLPCGFYFKSCLSKPISVLLSQLVCALVLSCSKVIWYLSYLARLL